MTAALAAGDQALLPQQRERALGRALRDLVLLLAILHRRQPARQLAALDLAAERLVSRVEDGAGEAAGCVIGERGGGDLTLMRLLTSATTTRCARRTGKLPRSAQPWSARPVMRHDRDECSHDVHISRQNRALTACR